VQEIVRFANLKVAIKQDRATETIVLLFAVDWSVFCCRIASKLESPLLENMQIAYRITDMLS
jgi:hypothetical protein